MEKQNYINWEAISQKEYRIKITTCTEKLNDQQKKLFKEILDCMKKAGGAEETVLNMLLEEADGSEYREQKLQLLLGYLDRDIKLEKLEQTASELEFYRKRAQGAEEKSRLLKKEIMGIKAKKHELEDALEECQKRLSLVEEENRNHAEQSEILLQIQENTEQIMAASREVKELVASSKGNIYQENVISNDAAAAEDNAVIAGNCNAAAEIDEAKKEEGGEENTGRQNDSQTEDILETADKLREDTVIITQAEEKKEETKKAAEYIEDMDEAFYEEFRGIALENAIDPDEYGILMEAAPGEIMYYPLEEEDETEEEFEEAGKNQRVNFFNELLGKMDLNHFRNLEPSEQISRLFDLMEEKQVSKEEKREFMELVMRGDADYGKIYQYLKEGREKELLKEE